MERVRLGASELEVSRLCLGTWNMNTKGDWGPADAASAIRLIHHALGTGCNFIDTARGYGDSEEIVGRALKGRREKAIVASKAVHCTPAALRDQIDTSLKNLQTDYIDLYICHWPSPSLSLDEFLDELARQREAGRIRAIGVSNFNLAQMRTAAAHGAVSLQPPFSILWRVADEVLDFCRTSNIAVTPYSPLAQGLLTGRYSRGEGAVTGPRRNNALFSERLFPAAREVAAAVDAIADRMGCLSSQAALAWVLRTPGITNAIVGASRVEQWDQTVGALEIMIEDCDYERLDVAGRQVWNMVGPEDSMWGWKPQ